MILVPLPEMRTPGEAERCTGNKEMLFLCLRRGGGRMAKGLQTKSYGEQLNDAGILSLEERSLRRDTIRILKYLKDCHTEEEGSSLS